MVQFPFLVQARPDENLIEHALLSPQPPQCAAWDQAARDGIQLVPARETAVGLAASFHQIGHFSSRSLLAPVARRRRQLITGERLPRCDCHVARAALASANAQCQWPVACRRRLGRRLPSGAPRETFPGRRAWDAGGRAGPRELLAGLVKTLRAEEQPCADRRGRGRGLRAPPPPDPRPPPCAVRAGTPPPPLSHPREA